MRQHNLSDAELKEIVSDGLVKIRLAKNGDEVEFIDITSYEYAYVIYDINHTDNMEYIRDFYEKEGIFLNGRFGNFEYWNMDRILRESLELKDKIVEKFSKKRS